VRGFLRPSQERHHAAFIELGTVADDENIRLHHGIDLVIGLIGLGQADVKGGGVGSAGFALECICYLAGKLNDNLLMCPRGGRRLPDVGGAIDQLIAIIGRPCDVVAVGMVLCVALAECHYAILQKSRAREHIVRGYLRLVLSRKSEVMGTGPFTSVADHRARLVYFSQYM